jgi:endogenous inhibitor of DNA gyrase (YacG/DUF329 family)
VLLLSLLFLFILSNMIAKKCTWCGKDYKTKPYMDKTSKFCSEDCRLSYLRRNNTFSPCVYCGKPIEINWKRKKRSIFYYCSQDCYKNSRAKSDVTCAGCGKIFQAHPSRQRMYLQLYCSQSCYIKHGLNNVQGFTHNIKYDNIRLRISKTSEYLKWKFLVLERDKYSCIKCGMKEDLRVHHVQELYRIIYKYNPELSPEKISLILSSVELNDVSNGITLCNSCHMKEHLQ